MPPVGCPPAGRKPKEKTEHILIENNEGLFY